MATEPRPNYVRREKARLDTADSRPRLRIRLRAAFGVNARADILAGLLAASPNGLNAADLARTTRFAKPSVASALDALLLAGLITAQPVGNERRFTVPTKVPILPGLRPPVPQADWVARFSVALEALRFQSRADMSTTVRAIEARRLVNALAARISAEHMPMPELDASGAAFAMAFDRWIAHLADWLRVPARS